MKKKKSLIDILIIVLRCVMVFAGYNVYKDVKDSRESRKQFDELEKMMTPHTEQDTVTPMTAGEKYAPLYELNNHFTGWLSIDDTQLNYPVMQTKSSPEYYLRRDFSKQYNYHGVPFMDYKCTVDESDNIIIYGHNMKDGSMFSAVESYMKPGFFENHRYIKFDTLSGYGLYEVVCVFKIDISTTNFAFNEAVDFASEEEFNQFITTAKSMAPYNSGVTAEYGDKLITLTTCEYTLEDGRCVLIAKKVATPEIKYFDGEGNETQAPQ